MSTYPRRPAQDFKIYPAYCFSASPTFDAWVKLTIADVHALTTVPEYRSQNIYFHLNHPIRYVRVVGSITAIEDINTRYTILTLDDGSGRSIEVKIVRTQPALSGGVDPNWTWDPHRAVNARTSTGDAAKSDRNCNTSVANLFVRSQPGEFEVMLHDQPLAIGTVLKTKSTLTSYRGILQLELQRAWIVHSTNEEAQAWLETAEFKRNVLDAGWVLSKREHGLLKEAVLEERREARRRGVKERERERERVERRERREERMRKYVRDVERKEVRERLVCDRGALI